MLDLRSLLFIPADADRFLPKAASRGADAIVLDLEDGVAVTAKATARAALHRAAGLLHAAGATVLVRINGDPALFRDDVAAAVAADAFAIVLPKVESAAQVQALERELQARGSQAQVLALIETPLGVWRALEIASAGSRLLGLCFGPEDYAAAMGVAPGPEGLAWPAQAVAAAAVAAGIQPLGLVGSVAGFADLDSYRELVRRSRAIGMRGAVCIHPAQVPVLNAEFGPTEAELTEASRIVAAFDKAIKEGRGAVAVDGRMVDEPVAQRARMVLQRNEARNRT